LLDYPIRSNAQALRPNNALISSWVCNQPRFTPLPFTELTYLRLPVGIIDVRTNFVRFALSFLKITDDSLKEEAMGVKGFLGGIFKSLPTDPAAVCLTTYSLINI